MTKKVFDLYYKEPDNFIKLIKSLFPTGSEAEGLQVVLYDKNKADVPYFLINNNLYSLNSIADLLEDIATKTKILKKFKLL